MGPYEPGIIYSDTNARLGTNGDALDGPPDANGVDDDGGGFKLGSAVYMGESILWKSVILILMSTILLLRSLLVN